MVRGLLNVTVQDIVVKRSPVAGPSGCLSGMTLLLVLMGAGFSINNGEILPVVSIAVFFSLYS